MRRTFKNISERLLSNPRQYEKYNGNWDFESGVYGIKNHTQIKKIPYKAKSHESTNGNKYAGNKFIVYKRPESQNLSMAMAYDHMSYIEDLQKMHNNIKDIVKSKGGIKFDSKRKKVAVPTKKQKNKNKRSATPGVSLPQHYIES